MAVTEQSLEDPGVDNLAKEALMSELALSGAQTKVVENDRAKALARLGLFDRLFHKLTFSTALLVLALLGGVIVSAIQGSLPAIRAFGLGFLFSQSWNPVTDNFGTMPPIYETVATSLIAMLVAVLGLGVAVFFTELCPQALRRPIGMAIELLAAIPSIIYGIWGLFVLAPFLQQYVQPALISTLGQKAQRRKTAR